MKTKKVNAFTLSEMLIVLVIASIVISLTFVILNLVQKQVRSIQQNFSQRQHIQLLERLLWKDLNTYDAFYNAQQERLKLRNAVDSITYSFDSDFVVREKDTIPIAINNKLLFLNGIKTTNGYIDAIEIITQQAYNTKNIMVYKQKDAAHYLNN